MTKNFDFHCSGSGAPILFVPGSYSTPAAWRPVQSHLPEGFEFFATSLSGYGQSRERRSNADISLNPQIDLLSEVVKKIGAPVHLVAHSFGGLVSLGFLETAPETVLSVTFFEANPLGLLKLEGESDLDAELQAMIAGFQTQVNARDPDAAKTIIDYYGGAGFFDALPENVRTYCTTTAKVNALDWQTGMSYRPNPERLAALNCPITLAYGSNTTAAMKTITRHLGPYLPKAQICEVKDAGHFLISTHPKDCAAHVLRTIRRAEALSE
ncbi:alpha/beta fold hydrolase [Rhodobacteraceae bacterium Araon29]